MNSIYTDNKEICLFINRAQNKIADLASLVVDRGGNLPESTLLLLELSSFLECLDSVYCSWTTNQVLTWIHEYNYRANLNEVAYLNIYGFTTDIKSDCSCSDSPNGGVNIPLHNDLAGLQGGKTNERYHVTKQMYDYLTNQLTPVTTPTPIITTPSTVSLNVTTNAKRWPSGYYELGVPISPADITASIAYGNPNKASYFEYLLNGEALGSRVNNPIAGLQPNSITDTTGTAKDVTYTFNASFPDGIKTAFRFLQFRQPMYYGILKRIQVDDSSLWLPSATKDVRDRGEMSITFNVPEGNTHLDYQQAFVPFLFIPKSWGKFTSAVNLLFDFSGDFIAKDYTMILANGTTAEGLLITYETQIEGLATFKFNW